MYLSTQPYINEVEYHIVRGLCHRWKEARYPTTFTPLAELFGYITQCGTLTEKTVEINFADCNLYPLMPKRIHFIFKQEWNHEGLRLNNRGHPRICGKKMLDLYVPFFVTKRTLLLDMNLSRHLSLKVIINIQVLVNRSFFRT